MYQTFFKTICRTGVFLICAQAVLHFSPKEVYVKYMKLLVSAMVLIQLVLPFGSLFLGGRKGELVQALEQFKQNMEQSLRQAEENTAEADRILEQMTLEEVRKAVEEQRKREEAEGLLEEGEYQEETQEGEEGASGGTEIEVKVEVETVKPVRTDGE